MRRRWAVLCAAVAALLAACASIPTTGPVNEGTGEVEGADPFVPFAEGPGADDGAAAIVSGFIRATAAGFASDFSVAREYLTEEARAEWDPLASITVFDSGALTPDYDEDAGTVVYSVPVAVWIDDAGRLVEAEAETQTQLEFTVTQNQAGEWRISGLDDGSLLAEATFNRLFLPVSLTFASMDGERVVPELRWLPQNNVATWAARELVAGPSPWLANAVRTGFPAGSALAVDSVVVTDGVARVQLAAQSAGSAQERALADQQLRLTLTALPGVRDVTVTAGGLPLVSESQDTLEREVAPAARAAVFAGNRLGLWDGEELRVIPDGGLPQDASALAAAFDGSEVAFLVGDGRVVVSDALAADPESLVAYDADAGAPAGVVDTDPLVFGDALAAPAYDRDGWVWTASASRAESVTVARSGGEVLSLEVRWLAGREVLRVLPSRDGARLLVVSRAGSQTVVEVAEVVRSDAGEPLSIGEPLRAGANIGDVADVAWVDDLTVALLGRSSGADTTPLWLVSVGGRTTAETAVPDAVGIAARQGDRTITLVSSDGTVRERSGTGWAGIATGVTELAYVG